MRSPNQIPHLGEALRTLDHVIDAVVERGYDENPEAADDYGELLARSFEHRKLVTFQLYDSYFQPKRHEFELQLLTLFVDAVASNRAAVFVAEAAAGGVIGNAAYAAVKHLLTRLVSKSKPIKRIHDSFKEIEMNTDRIKLFFRNRRQASIGDICKVLDAEPGKIEPLLKLLGFRSRRAGKRRIWVSPFPRASSRKKKPT